jgi:hypothetical protein
MPEDEEILPEHVEGPGPSFRVVAVCVPHFDRQNGSYQGEHKDTYVLGFELTAGSFDVSTLRTDPRFAHDPRLIIYESTTTFIQRFDLESRQARMLFPDGSRAIEHRVDPNSLRFQIGSMMSPLFPFQNSQHPKDPSTLQETSSAPWLPPAQMKQGPPMDMTVRMVVIRTSSPLNHQEVQWLRQTGAINDIAKNFASPTAQHSALSAPTER